MSLRAFDLSGYPKGSAQSNITMDTRIMTPLALTLTSCGRLSWAGIQLLNNRMQQRKTFDNEYIGKMKRNAAKHLFGLLTGLKLSSSSPTNAALHGLGDIRILNNSEKSPRLELSSGMSLPNYAQLSIGSAWALWSLQQDSQFGFYTDPSWFDTYGVKADGTKTGIENDLYFNAYRQALTRDTTLGGVAFSAGDTTLDQADVFDLFTIFVIRSWARGGSGLTPEAACLHPALALPGQPLLITGTVSPTHLRENITAVASAPS